MNRALQFLVLLGCSFSALAGTNLLDLYKAGKAQYNTGCQSFIQSATHDSLKSDAIKKALQPASGFSGFDLYYFHYTNAPQVSQLVQSKSYNAIMEYQMTYSDALSNAAGVGFYLSANPFSSASYGSSQVSFSISPDAKIFDSTADANTYQSVLRQKIQSEPGFSSCAGMVQYSLLMNENGADLVYYNRDSQWFVVYNEDILKDSAVTPISGNVLTSMASNGLFGPLMSFITEFGSTESSRISLDQVFSAMGMVAGNNKSDSIKAFADKMTSWTESTRVSFAKVIASTSGTELQSLMNDFKKSNRVQESDYLKISFETSSKDFLSMIGAMIKVNPSIMQNWKADYTTRMAILMAKNIVDMDFFLQNAPGGMDKAKLYSIVNDRTSASSLRSAVINYIVTKDPRYFQSLKEDAKAGIVYTFMAGAGKDEIPGFVNTTTKLGYDHKNITDRLSSNSFGANTPYYMKAVLRTQTDPKFLDGYYVSSIIASDPSQSLVDYIIELRQNKNINREIVDSLAKRLSSNLTQGNISRLQDPQVLAAFSKAEIKAIAGKLIGSGGAYGDQILKMLKTKGFSSYDIFDTLYDYGGDSNSNTALAILTDLKKDSTYWTQFSSLKNSSGVVKILNNGNLYRLQGVILSNWPETVYSPPFNPGLINPGRLSSVFNGNILSKYFNNYSDDDKMRIILFLDDSTNQLYSLIQQIKFTPELVKKYLPTILQNKEKMRLVNYLTYRPDFVATLNINEFKSVVNFSAGSYGLSKAALADTKVMDFDKALYLSMSNYGGNNNCQDEVDQTFFDDKIMSAEEITKFVNAYVKGFKGLSSSVRNRYWKKIFNLGKDKPVIFDLISLWDDLGNNFKWDYLQYFTSDEAKIPVAVKAFKAKGQKFLQIIMEWNEQNSSVAAISWIEKNYPVKEPYAGALILRYSRGNAIPEKTKHFQEYLCKKINNYTGVSVGAEEIESQSRPTYDVYVKKVCQ